MAGKDFFDKVSKRQEEIAAENVDKAGKPEEKPAEPKNEPETEPPKTGKGKQTEIVNDDEPREPNGPMENITPGQEESENRGDKKQKSKAGFGTYAILTILFASLAYFLKDIFTIGSYIAGMIAAIVFVFLLIALIKAGLEKGITATIGMIPAYTSKQNRKNIENEEHDELKGGRNLPGPIEVIILIILWTGVLLVIVFLILLILFSIYLGILRGFMAAFGLTMALGMLIYLWLSKSAVEVKAVPPHIAILTVLGSKTGFKKMLILVKDGLYPTIGGDGTGTGIIDFAPINMELKDLDLPEMTIWTSENIAIVVLPMLTVMPNINDILDYVGAGGFVMIKKSIDNNIAQGVIGWGKNRPIEEVLKLNAEEVKKILLELTESRGDKKAVAAILGVVVPTFSLRVKSIDTSALKAMMQQFIEQKQQQSEMTEMDTERLLTLQIIKESTERGEPITYKEAYKIVKHLKLLREVGVGVVPGLDEALGKGTASIVDAALLALAGILPKMTEGKPVDVSKSQQKDTARNGGKNMKRAIKGGGNKEKRKEKGRKGEAPKTPMTEAETEEEVKKEEETKEEEKYGDES